MKLRQMKLRLLLVERLSLPGFWGSGMSTGRSENTACVPKVPVVCVLGQGVVAGMPAHLASAGDLRRRMTFDALFEQVDRVYFGSLEY